MAEKDKLSGDVLETTSLEEICENLRHAILRLPRGVVRECLFVSLLKAIRHGSTQRFQLMQKVLLSMGQLANDPNVTDEVNQLIAAAHAQLRARVNPQETAL